MIEWDPDCGDGHSPRQILADFIRYIKTTPLDRWFMAFLTGSRSYGTPHAGSDTDLCVLVSLRDMMVLSEQCDASEPYVGLAGASLRFGKLNLVTFCDPDEYTAWEAGTNQLKSIQPTRKDVAIEVLEQNRGVIYRGRADAAMWQLGVLVVGILIGAATTWWM